MKNDLNDHLLWLEDELLEAPDLTGEDLDLDSLLNDFLNEEPELAPDPIQNRAMDFDRMAFDDEAFDESTAVLVSRKKNKELQPKSARKKGIKGLVFLAVLEVIAIIAVLLRWVLWFL